MIILLVINVIGLFVTVVNVLLFIETLSNEKEISKEHKNNLDYLDEISHKLNSVANTVERNNLKYETQFNDIWHSSISICWMTKRKKKNNGRHDGRYSL